MAIVEVKSSIFGAVSGGAYVPPNASSRDGKEHIIQGSVANGANNSSGSKYLLCSLPWSAILLPETAFRTDGWGFAQVQIGPVEAPTGLLNAAKGVSTTGQTPVVIFGANWNEPLWQACGLAAMPVDNGYADLWATTIAGATGAGAMQFMIRYVNHVG